MRAPIRALALVVQFTLSASAVLHASSQDEEHHRQSMSMVQTVIDRSGELSLTESEVKRLKALRSELEFRARQGRVSSRPGVTNRLLLVTPERARSRILGIVGDSRDEAVLRVVGAR
jgi:hypothetical protein